LTGDFKQRQCGLVIFNEWRTAFIYATVTAKIDGRGWKPSKSYAKAEVA